MNVMPPLGVLLDSFVERERLIAYAAQEFRDLESLLFLVLARDWKRRWTSSAAVSPPMARRPGAVSPMQLRRSPSPPPPSPSSPLVAAAQAIYDEYLGPEAQHAIVLRTDEFDKLARKVGRKLSGKAGSSFSLKRKPAVGPDLFDAVCGPVAAMLERGLLVDYLPVWSREQRLDHARRTLVAQIDFDLDKPPPLEDLLANPTSREQLRVFAVSLMSEEAIDFYHDVHTIWIPAAPTERLAIGRRLVASYIALDAPRSLNLGHEERQSLVSAYAAGEAMPFAVVLEAVERQMKQNLYYPFIAHLVAERDQQRRLERMVQAEREAMGERPAVPPPKSVAQVLADPIQTQEFMSYAGRMYNQERVVFFVLVSEFHAETKEDARVSMGVAHCLLGIRSRNHLSAASHGLQNISRFCCRGGSAPGVAGWPAPPHAMRKLGAARGQPSRPAARGTFDIL